MRTERDCADAFTFKCNNEMQQEHFGDSRNLSMEGCLLFSFTKEAMKLHSAGRLENVTEQHKEHVFHCHLSGDTSQNAATTHHHMKQLIEILIEDGTLEKGSTIHDNSDGCAKQHQCGASLHLLSMLAESHNIKINRGVSAPGHGKGMVDTQMVEKKQH